MNYIKDFLEIDSTEMNEETLETLLFLSIAVLSEIILDKLHFEKNKDLKEFTTDVLLENYKDYLFDSRPTLYARVVKDIRGYKRDNPERFLEIERNVQEFISSKDDGKLQEQKENSSSVSSGKRKKQKSSNKKVIDDWRSIIES